jgi:N-acetylmuramoyl-L-alanine amidase
MRRLLSAACLVALVCLPLPGRCAATAARASAAGAALFAQAEASFAALKANPQAQRQRHNFARVLEGYRRVFEKYPATREGEAALMRAGELLTFLFRWTGQEGDLNRAQNYYQRLVQTAPKSPLVDDALLAIGYLYLDQFKDPAQAWQRFREVTKIAPAGDKAPEARRQLKRLAAYAVAEPAAPPPGPVDLACPVTPAAENAAAGPRQAANPTPPLTSAPAAPAAPAVPPGPALTRIRNIRHWSNPEYSRVVIDLDQKTNFYSNLLEDRSGSGKPPRLYIDLFASLVEERFCKPIAVNDGILNGVRAGQFTPESVRVVLEIDRLRTYRVFPMQNPFRIVIDITGGAADAALPAPVASTGASPVDPPAQPPPVQQESPTVPADGRSSPPDPHTSSAVAAPRYSPEPVPELRPLPALTATAPAPGPSPTAAVPVSVLPATSGPTTFSGAAAVRSARPATGASRSAARVPAPAGKPSLARQLGLGVRRVVIDAGHGAHDPGAIGVDGLQEKDVTLDLALRVRDILEAAGYEAVLTRDRDVYLPLEERTALANTARGDIFLSLHCNSSDAGNLSGVETYFLNLASSVRSMQTAARENSMAVANMSDLQQIVREIQNSKMDESSQFAWRVQRSVHDALHRRYPDVKNLGVKQAPFYVLIGAQMPSILAEVSFINNRTEGRRLADPQYRQLIAQALVDGVKRYVRTVKTAAAGPGRPTP